METPFSGVKMKFVMPFFMGVLLSLIFCALIGVSYGFFKLPEHEVIAESEPEEILEEEAEEHIFSESEKISDIVLEYFRNPEYRRWVINFFTDICSSPEVSQAILENCYAFNVPPALAFALGWEESRLNPYAENRSNRDGSIDRGLFQLNNRSFPNVDIPDFFNIQTNARYGVGHLRFCLDSGASEVSALAMYNAGAARVRSTGAPEVTLNYISRILENRLKIESNFHSRLIREEEQRILNMVSAPPPSEAISP